ncbi:hypothetical protein ACQ4PT_026103 [Festuca glaucescens]
MDRQAKGGTNVQKNLDLSNVHIGVGCDSCGVCPIMGMRYKCKDCTERIGFDLCGECYNSRSKLPGRFNQQHTSDHRMELDNTRLYEGLIAQLALIGAGGIGAAIADDHEIEDDTDEDVELL